VSRISLDFRLPVAMRMDVQFPIAKAHMAVEEADLMRLKAAARFCVGELCEAEAITAKCLTANSASHACIRPHPSTTTWSWLRRPARARHATVKLSSGVIGAKSKQSLVRQRVTMTRPGRSRREGLSDSQNFRLMCSYRA